MAADEHRVLGWTLLPDSTLTGFRLDTGELVERRRLFDGKRLTAASFSLCEGAAAFGFDDGSVRLGTIGVAASIISEKDLPEQLRNLKVGGSASYQAGIVRRMPGGQLRLHSLSSSLDEPVPGAAASTILLIDHVARPGGYVLATCSADAKLRLSEVSERRNLLTGKVTFSTNARELPFDARRGLPRFLLVSGTGTKIYAAWEDGRLLRCDAGSSAALKVAEELDLVPEPGERLTALAFMIGTTTLVAGDSLGRVRAWFCTTSDDAGTSDHARLVNAHAMQGPSAAVTSLAPSARSRLLGVGYANGTARLYHVTSSRLIADVAMAGGLPVQSIAMLPKDDGLVCMAGRQLACWQINARHPEATLTALFAPVWYEGYPKPALVWQSSGATDDFEPKLGLVPLIFGTVKATFYSLVFGVPIALLAAVYTSEFLRPSMKAKVKPAIELMASLPSVVLGFLAALVFAPFVENVVPAALTAVVTVPFALLLGAHLWQLLPQRMSLRLARLRLGVIAVSLPLGVAAAAVLGPAVERLLFLGNIKLWLDGRSGSGFGGWVFLLLPASAVATGIGLARLANPWLRHKSVAWSRGQCGLAALAKFVAGSALAIGASVAIGAGMTLMGFDPRGSFVGTYVQRNALVVGFVMGFAIIPIIYTIAEDALSAVPEHLRSASLGAGATPWQTAARIIIPTAMSGLFSAVMVGLGRAVGETMVVLMAAGNTPIMQLNPFNGFRTLSANIAVELPEAVRDSTHYRTLFLAGLTLFAMTFIVNTVAEAVRLRFRKRAYQL